jgi:serine O-acetyltransferase
VSELANKYFEIAFGSGGCDSACSFVWCRVGNYFSRHCADMDQDWLSDLRRVGGSRRELLREQSLWAIWVYRFGRRIDQRPNGLRKKWMLRWYWFLQRLVETLTGIGLPKSSRIGPGLRIWHFGGIFIHPEVVIGSNCTLRQGVVLGDKGNESGAPVVGDHVEFGSGAHVLGPVRIGDHVKIGALAVVLSDVPSGCTVVGNPARIVKRVAQSDL